jgi:hypothetical protein
MNRFSQLPESWIRRSYMIKCKLLVAVIAGAMLIQESAKAQEVRGEHFLIQLAVIPGLEAGLVNPIFDQICGAEAGIRRTAPCPLTLTTVPTRRNFFPPRSKKALLPHLRADADLRMGNERARGGAVGGRGRRARSMAHQDVGACGMVIEIDVIRTVGINLSGDQILHRGNQRGFHAFAVASVEQKSGMVIMTNGDNGWKLNTRVVEQVVERALSG